MSLIGVISDFATGTYDVTRTAAGTTVKGRYTEGAESTFSITACIQPVQGRELDVPAEGESGSEIRVVYSDTELLTRTPTTEPDEIEIDGESWIVTRVERWQHFGEEHWRAYVTRAALV